MNSQRRRLSERQTAMTLRWADNILKVRDHLRAAVVAMPAARGCVDELESVAVVHLLGPIGRIAWREIVEPLKRWELRHAATLRAAFTENLELKRLASASMLEVALLPP